MIGQSSLTAILLRAAVCLVGGITHPFILWGCVALYILSGKPFGTNIGAIDKVPIFVFPLFAIPFFLCFHIKWSLVKLVWRRLAYRVFWKATAWSQIPNLHGIYISWWFCNGLEGDGGAILWGYTMVTGGASVIMSNIIFICLLYFGRNDQITGQ